MILLQKSPRKEMIFYKRDLWFYPQVSNVTHLNDSRRTSERDMSLIWICLIKCTNESCDTSEYVSLHSWISVAHTNTSCVTCACIMARLRNCHVTHVNASCHTCECVMARVWMCNVTHVNASCHACVCVMSHMWMRHDTHVNAWCH